MGKMSGDKFETIRQVMAENRKTKRKVLEVNYTKKRAREMEMISVHYEGIEEPPSKLNRSVVVNDSSVLTDY